MKIAYLSNSFPEPTESYIWEEICELRQRNWEVLPCSVERPAPSLSSLERFALQTLYVFPLQLRPSCKASWRCISHLFLIRDLIGRAIRGPEPWSRRLRALAHTWLGAYLAELLRETKIKHIHIHHGYFSAWVGMAAARFLHASFSMTLHGSDLLVRANYLDVKLKHCRFCMTVSEFNRRHIHDRYPEIDSRKILVQRLGIDPAIWQAANQGRGNGHLSILSVGRLHPVKNYGFLVLACRALKARGVRFRCAIAGEGEERGRLERLISQLELEQEVRLLGRVPRERLPELYAAADAVVLTSNSEGVPVTLMEAMAMERVVLAPKITGIPEIVLDGQAGFLYLPNSMESFLTRLELILHGGKHLAEIRQAARQQIEAHFNSRLNLPAFATCFLEQLNSANKSAFRLTREEAHENPVLQQI
jgi:glycosyltransferase involved in cell wall biosynthesis